MFTDFLRFLKELILSLFSIFSGLRGRVAALEAMFSGHTHADLGDRITALENAPPPAAPDLTAMQEQLAAMQAAVTETKAMAEGNTSRIAAVQAELDALANFDPNA